MRSPQGHGHRRRGLAALAVLAGVLLIAPACRSPLNGEWRAVEVRPGRHIFLLDEVTFNPDGGYAARTVRGGIAGAEQGRYEFTGSRLKLWPQAGGLHTYRAQRRWDRLEVRDGERRVVLRKTN